MGGRQLLLLVVGEAPPAPEGEGAGLLCLLSPCALQLYKTLSSPGPTCHSLSLSISNQLAFNQPQCVSRLEPLLFPQSLQQSANQVFTECQLQGGAWGSRNSKTGSSASWGR